MTWGRKRSYGDPAERAPAVAFRSGRRNSPVWEIERVIEQLEEKQVRLAKQAFDAQELKLLFIEPCWRQTLTDAYRLVEPAGTTQELWVNVVRPTYAFEPNTINPPIRIAFGWHHHNCPDCFYVPHDAGAGPESAVNPRDDAPSDLLDKFDQVTSDLIDIHWRFAQVKKVFNRLNKNEVCRTPAQMRYVWPCIYTLCKLAKLDETAQEIEHASERAGANVNVPSALLQMLHPTNDTIVRAMFLNGVVPPEEPKITMYLSHSF